MRSFGSRSLARGTAVLALVVALGGSADCQASVAPGLDEGRDHWSFQPLDRTSPPTKHAWSWSQIDEFIAAERSRRHLPTAPDADRRALIRRAYFQLIGLPPTPEELARFLADPRPDAFQRVVDELLASPRFGERWGRHWLDLARYADSNGLDENFLFREAWRYRNWVIAAINEDVPFDLFTANQIAGDLLPFDSIEQRDNQRIASGFLVVGPKVLLGVKPERQRMEVADEQLDTVGRAFLGLTVGCARCHDHKFEPIPTADYYALAGIMTSTSVMERRHMLNQQRTMERLVGLGDNGEALDAAYESYWRNRPQLKQRSDRAQTALAHLKKDEASKLSALLKKHPEAVAKDARDSKSAKPRRIEAQQKLIAELAKTLASPPPIPPRAMVPGDVAAPGDEAVRRAGEVDKLGDMVPRGFIQVVSRPGRHTASIRDQQSGRMELARWLTDTESGAGNLTARVIANRVWHHLVGRGIVRTVDNFGVTGESPSHPELLDHLANELIESNWSIKALVRRVTLSRSFALASETHQTAVEADPENQFLWRGHRRRLDPESLRDAMLSAAGSLDTAWVDSTVNYLGDQATAVGANKNRRRTDFKCRSVYLPVIRNDLPEVFEAFDFADPHKTTGARDKTTAAAQGLFMLNDKTVLAAADAAVRRLFAESPHNDGERVGRMFELCFNEPPTQTEREQILSFIETARTRLAKDDAEDAGMQAWSLAFQALVASSRFQFLD